VGAIANEVAERFQSLDVAGAAVAAGKEGGEAAAKMQLGDLGISDITVDGTIVLDPQRFFGGLAMRVITRVALGQELDDEVREQIANDYKEFVGGFNRVAFFLPGYLDTPLPAARKMRRLICRLHEHAYRVIAKERAAAAASGATGPTHAKRTTLLSALLEAHDDVLGSLTEEEVVHNVYGFFFAGTSTTSCQLATTAFMLARHSKVQARLRSEMDTVELGATSPTGSVSDCPAWDALKAKSYVTAVITESLRLWPSAEAVTGRRMTKKVELGGLQIPQGTQVGANSLAVQRRVSIWGEDAAEFRPERFLENPSAGTQRNFTPCPMSPSPMPEGVPDSAFTAFGGGVRPCIGRALAMIEMKFVLVHLLQRFTLVEMEPDKFEMARELSVAPKSTLKLGLKRR